MTAAFCHCSRNGSMMKATYRQKSSYESTIIFGTFCDPSVCRAAPEPASPRRRRAPPGAGVGAMALPAAGLAGLMAGGTVFDYNRDNFLSAHRVFELSEIRAFRFLMSF